MRTALIFLAVALLGAACDGSILSPTRASSVPGGSSPGGETWPVDPTDPSQPSNPAAPLVCDDHPHGATTELRRLTPAQYRNAIAVIFAGHVAPSAQYPGTYGLSTTGYSTEPSLSIVGEQGAEQLMAAAEEVALAVAPVVTQVLPCASASNPGTSCFGTYLDTVGRRAYRRALTADERTALTSTFQAAVSAGATFKEAVALATAALLQSPQFVYLAEGAAGSGRALDSDELASRLALMLWDSVPDDTLLDVAAAGQLTAPATLAAQAQRMLAASNADTALARLLREWTQTNALTSSDKDSTVFPYFTADYATSLNGSFDRFAAAQLRTGTLASLLTTTDAYVDANLAPRYGVSAPPNGQWAKVSLDATRYSGVGTQALLLASAAHTNASSFVFRGRFVRRRLLCNVFGPPPADAQAQFASIPLPPNPTGKEVSAAVLAHPACAGCHALMNPAGLSLEHFDGAGAWRDTYDSGRAIDPSGTLPGVDGANLTFASQVDLFAQLADSTDAASCTARQLFRFTFSRPETQADACALQAIQTALAASGGSLGDALLAVVATDAFSWRVDP